MIVVNLFGAPGAGHRLRKAQLDKQNHRQELEYCIKRKITDVSIVNEIRSIISIASIDYIMKK